jgi:hypothetical protein
MLLGSPLRAEISRKGSASPDDRNADSSCDEWTTDFTRYGSRAGGLVVMASGSLAMAERVNRDGAIMLYRFATRNGPKAEITPIPNTWQAKYLESKDLGGSPCCVMRNAGRIFLWKKLVIS